MRADAGGPSAFLPGARHAGATLICGLAVLGIAGGPGPAVERVPDASRPRVVVLPFAEIDVPPGTGARVADDVAGRLARTGRVTINAGRGGVADVVVRGRVRATPAGRLAADVVVLEAPGKPPPPHGAADVVLTALRAVLGETWGGLPPETRGAADRRRRET